MIDHKEAAKILFEHFENLSPEEFKKNVIDFCRPEVESCGLTYRIGMAYYELTKSEKIQLQKQICVMDRKSKKVYSGSQARDLLGLPGNEIHVRPQDNPEYSVFVQSTSVNRKLMDNTTLLVVL